MSSRSQVDSASPLDPTLEQRLVEFGRRRQQLRLLRGAAYCLASAGSALLASVLLQAWATSDTIDTAISIGFYSICALALAWFVLRPCLQRVSLVDLARILERLDGSLKYRLLPAVELAATAAVPNNGSAEFHAEVQRAGGEAVEYLDFRRLLPWQRIRWALLAVTICAVVLLIAVCVPSWQAAQRFAQVLLPSANIGKVTNVSIEIVRPLPQSRSLPTGDSLAVTAEVRGPQSTETRLQWRSAAQAIATNKIQSQSMLCTSEQNQGASQVSQFESVLVADDFELEYRATSGDAATPWYRLSTSPRPKIEQLRAKLIPPEYLSRLAGESTKTAEQATEGNLQVLQGSEVVLTLTPNIDLRSAELEWQEALPLKPASPHTPEPSSKKNTQPLTPIDDAWTIRFSPMSSGDYKLRLRADASGYTNEFDPTYRITLVEDQPSQIRWLKPLTNPHMVSQQSLLDLTLETIDEHPVQEIVLLQRINESAWTEIAEPAVTLSRAVGDDFQAAAELQSVQEHQWTIDLLPWRLVGGDHIDLVARVTDAKSQTRESLPMRVVISDLQLAAATSPAYALRQQIAQRLQELATKIQKATSDDSERDDLLLERELIDGARKDLLDIFGLVEQTSLLTSDFAERVELKLAGDALATLHLRLASKMQSLGTSATKSRQASNTGSDGRLTVPNEDFWNRELKSTGDLAGSAQQLAEAFQTWVTYDRIAIIAEQIAELRSALDDLQAATRDTDPQVQQLVRRQSVLALQMERLQQQLTDGIEQLRPGSIGSIERLAQMLGTQVMIVERESGQQQLGTLQHNASRLVEVLKGVRTVHEIDPGLLQSVTSTRLDIGQRYSMSSYSLELLHRELLNSLDDDRTNAALQTVGSQLELVRSLNRATQVGGGALAADLGLAGRAVGQLAVDTPASEPSKRIAATREIFLALRVLEGDDALHTAMRALHGLAGPTVESTARDSRPTPRTALDAWYMTNEFLRIAATQLGQSNAPSERSGELWSLINGPLAQALRSSEQNARKQNFTAGSNSASEPLRAKDVALGLAQIQSRLKPTVIAARATLRRLAPSIPDLAKQASQDTFQLSRDAAQLSDALRQRRVPDLTPRVAQVQTQAGTASQSIEELRNALVDLAESQNLLSSEEIEVARLADVALNIATEAERQIDGSMQDIMQASAAEAQVSEAGDSASVIERASREQNQAAGVLAMVGEMLDDPGASSAAMAANGSNQIEPESLQPPLRDPIDGDDLSLAAQQRASAEQYAQAQRLAQIAEAQPDEVLRQLEGHLPKNKAMQRELSNIAKQTLTQAQQQLSATAAQQRPFAAALELSDPEIDAERERLKDNLSLLRQTLQSIPLVLAGEAKWAAGSARQQESAVQMNRQIVRLEELSGLIADDKLPSEAAGFDPLLDALRSGLRGIGTDAEGSSQELQRAAAKGVHKTPTEREQKRREFKDRGRRLQQQLSRNAQQLERNLQQQLRSAERRQREAQKQVQRTEEQQRKSARRLEQLRTTAAAAPEQLAAGETAMLRDQQKLQLASLAQREAADTLELLRADVERLQQQTARWNRYQAPPLDSENPSAELASELATQLAQSVGELAENVPQLRNAPESVRATAERIAAVASGQRAAREQIQLSQSSLERATRHELRLQHTASAQALSQIADSIAQSAGAAAEDSLEELTAAENSGRVTEDMRASAELTLAAIVSARNSERATQAIADQLQQMLASSEQANPKMSPSGRSAGQQAGSKDNSAQTGPEGTPASSAPPPTPLDGESLARLLDELDQLLSAEGQEQSSLGKQEDASGGGRMASENAPSQRVVPTLTQAARRLAEQLSRSRQPPSDQPPGDIGMATDAAVADAQPQPPSPPTILDVNRLGSDWGMLTERSADDVTGTRRESLPAEFRDQVEAYFRELATRAASGNEVRP